MIQVKSKKDALNLRWLQLAVSSNTTWREAITGIRVKEEKAEATDGYRIHVGPIPESLNEFSGEKKGIKVNGGGATYKSPDREYPIQKTSGDFPETSHIFPKKPPKTVLAINREFLKDALEMPVGKDGNGNPGVILKFYPEEVYDRLIVQTGDGSHQALIMGMSLKGTGYELPPEDKDVKKAYKALDILLEKYPNIHAEVMKEI